MTSSRTSTHSRAARSCAWACLLAAPAAGCPATHRMVPPAEAPHVITISSQPEGARVYGAALFQDEGPRAGELLGETPLTLSVYPRAPLAVEIEWVDGRLSVVLQPDATYHFDLRGDEPEVRRMGAGEAVDKKNEAP